jgi:beta-galactosidase
MRNRLALNGIWRMQLDPHNVGREELWGEQGLAEGTPVTIPGIVQEVVKDYREVAWFERTFALADCSSGQSTWLCFGAVNYRAEVWVNGQRVGAHEGGYTPFACDISDALLCSDDNRVVVRVSHAPADKRVDDYALIETPCWKETWYYQFCGIWQDVYLETRAATYISDLFAMPDIRTGAAQVVTHLHSDGQTDEAVLTYTIASLEGIVAHWRGQVALEEGEIEVSQTLQIRDWQPWSLENPYLYDVAVTLEIAGNQTDAQSCRLGMRAFTAAHDGFYLNGRKIFLKGILHQGCYPLTLAFTRDQAMLRRELEMAKEAGFNLVRLHIKPAPPETLDLCDELGLLVYAEPPIGWIADSPFLRERCLREVRELVLRDRNHPSVIIWGMLNETGNYGWSHTGGTQAILDDLCQLTRDLDPTRLIIDQSGYLDTFSHCYGPSYLYLPYQREKTHYWDIHSYQPYPVPDYVDRYYRTLGTAHELAILSEMGCGGAPHFQEVLARFGNAETQDKDTYQNALGALQRCLQESGVHDSVGGIDGYQRMAQTLHVQGLSRQIRVLQANPNCSGFSVTQLADAGKEFGAGLLDLWRQPKVDLGLLKQANAPLLVTLRPVHDAGYVHNRFDVRIEIVNRSGREVEALLVVQVMYNNLEIAAEQRSVCVRQGIDDASQRFAFTPVKPGVYRVSVKLVVGGEVGSQDERSVAVLEQPSWPTRIGIIDPEGSLAVWLQNNASLEAVPVEKDGPIPESVLVGKIADPRSILRVADVIYRAQLANQEGGQLVYLETPAASLGWTIPFFVRKARFVPSFFNSIALIKNDALFQGIPHPGYMDDVWANLLAQEMLEPVTIREFSGDSLITGIQCLDGVYQWGSLLSRFQNGRGHLYLSMLHLAENLGQEPVAEVLLSRMLKGCCLMD